MQMDTTGQESLLETESDRAGGASAVEEWPHAEVYQGTGRNKSKKLIAGSESSQPTNSSPEPSRGIEDIWPREKDPGET